MVHTIITGPVPGGGACTAKHYYNSSGPYSNPGVSMELITDISKAIISEYEAIHCYGYLINQTSNSEIKEQIIEIRNDEICHYQTFYNLYLSLTKTHPHVSSAKQCPPDFKNGIITAFKDEQKTVDFYHEIARNINEMYIKEPFQQAALDEQNHAIWFLYFMKYL